MNALLPRTSLCYLATPYSHPDAEIREVRFRLACAVTGELLAQGFRVISPIVHGHSVAQVSNLPGDWEFWSGHCRALLTRCDRLLVLRVNGWRESVGVRAEIELAEGLRMPVHYLPYPLVEAL